MSEQEGWDLDPDRVVVRDKRRLDPQSGELRDQPADPAPADDAAPTAEPAAEPAAEPEADRVAELTADLQRVSAEYAIYR